MKWGDYVRKAVATAPDQPPEMQLAQAACGLPDEVREYLDADGQADVWQEAGDCLWYIAVGHDALRLLVDDRYLYRGCGAGSPPWTWAVAAPQYRIDLLKAAARASGSGEGIGWQKKPVEHQLSDLTFGFGAVASWIHDSLPVADILSRNADKLRSRHGDSFTPADEQKR